MAALAAVTLVIFYLNTLLLDRELDNDINNMEVQSYGEDRNA